MNKAYYEEQGRKFPKKPTTGFRGVWCPAGMFDQLAAGIVNGTDIMLWMIIESFVKSKGEGGGGCFAGNRYLAERLNLSDRALKHHLKKLIDLKLVISWTDDENQRWLETNVSRICEVQDMGVEGDTIQGSKRTPYSNTLKVLQHKLELLPSQKDDGGVDVKGLIPEFEPTPDPRVLQVDDFCAVKLHKIVVDKLQLARQWSRRAWRREMALLRHELNDPLGKRIKVALDWYAEHAGTNGTPPIQSASGLRKHWVWLEQQMKKPVKINPDKIPVDYSDTRVDFCIRKLLNFNWPKGADQQIPAVVQLSITRYDSILKAIAEQGTQDKHAQRIWQKMDDCSTFVVNWFTAIYQNVKEWDAWSGSLTSYVITADKLRRQGRSLANSVTGDPDYWDRLMEVIGEGRKVQAG